MDSSFYLISSFAASSYYAEKLNILEGLKVTPGGKFIKKLPRVLAFLFNPCVERVSFNYFKYLESLSLVLFGLNCEI